MARKTPGIPAADSPSVMDDFSLIKGIGPVLSRRLHEAGICTYDQLASLSTTELAEKVKGLSARQIAKQDWVGQAKKLAPKKTRTTPLQKEAPKQALHQHYENFTIEFLLDEKKTMRRTRVVHIQSGDADTWTGWEADQLIDFLARHTGTRLLVKKLEKKESLQVSGVPSNNLPPDLVPTTVRIAEPAQQLPDIPKIAHSGIETVPLIYQSPQNTGFAGILRLKDFVCLPSCSNTPARSLQQGQPCRVRITLDLTSVVPPKDTPLQYKVIISFKQLGGVSYGVAEENGPIERSSCVTQNFVCITPPPGLYRPEAFVKLFSDKIEFGLMASLSGELIQVI